MRPLTVQLLRVLARATCVVAAMSVIPLHAGMAQRNGAARTNVTSKYDPTFRKYSKRYFSIAFDWRYFKAQAMAESELNPQARSRVGARGLMQLMPSTYQQIATHRPEWTSIDDPEFNVAAGILHDRDLWIMWSASVDDDSRPPFMFGTYNAGEGPITRAAAVAKAKKLDHVHWSAIELVAPEIPRWRYQEMLGYVRKIGRNYDVLRDGRPIP